MRNFVSPIFGATGAVTTLLVSGCLAQAKPSIEDVYQTKFLNSCFSVIKRNKIGVRVVVKPYQKIGLMGGNRDLKIGFRFNYFEKDFSYKYEVKSIDRDGVRITYKGRNFEGEDVSGGIKLRWKP